LFFIPYKFNKYNTMQYQYQYFFLYLIFTFKTHYHTTDKFD
jgi:hypothetical protein